MDPSPSYMGGDLNFEAKVTTLILSILMLAFFMCLHILASISLYIHLLMKQKWKAVKEVLVRLQSKDV